MNYSCIRLVSSAVRIAAFLATIASAQSQVVNDLYNVVLQDGADPSIVHHTDGYYYRTKTTGGNVTLWRMKTLSGVGTGESKVIWNPTAGTGYSGDIWAPELFFYSATSKWYVYFAADDGTNANHRMYVLESAGVDPFSGSWTFRGQINDSTNLWAIDGTVFQVGTQLYMIWSGWPSTSSSQQNLYIASMSNPWTINSSRVQISSPSYSWETGTAAIQEGPEVLIQDNKISVIYSASASWTNSYCLGQLTANPTSNLLSASSWTKKSTSVFSSANGIYGPGHCTFTTSPDFTEDWIVYHCSRWSGAGWTRQVRMQKFTWNSDGTPNFGSPVSHDARITQPAGEIVRYRYEAENATLTGSPTVTSDSTASNGKFVTLDTTSKAVQFTVTVPETAEYVLGARSATSTSDQSAASFSVSVNGGSASSLSVVHSGWQNWGVSDMRITLPAGASTIRFTKNVAIAQLDEIDLFPSDPAAASMVFETETLAIANSSGDTHRIIAAPEFSGGSGTILDANAVGDYVTYIVPGISAGSYNVRVGVKKLDTRGICQLAIGTSTITPTNLGSPQDQYAAAEAYTELNLGTWTPGSTSDKWFRFTVTGKNASSSGYSICFDYIKLTPQ